MCCTEWKRSLIFVPCHWIVVGYCFHAGFLCVCPSEVYLQFVFCVVTSVMFTWLHWNFRITIGIGRILYFILSKQILEGWFYHYWLLTGRFSPSLAHCSLEISKRVIGKQCRHRCCRHHRMWCLIRVTTVCKQFSHFSLRISKWHSLTYLQLKLDSSNI